MKSLNAQSDLEKLNKLAWLLDSSIKIPGTKWTIGLDGLIGLIPGIGDISGGVISSYIVLQAVKNDVSKLVVARMLFNIFLETTIGVIPVVGDIFDFAFKANRRNVRLMQNHLDNSVAIRKHRGENNMNIFEALRKDHEIQRKLSDQLIETHGDNDVRDELFNQLKIELKAHAAAEERHFYIPLMEDDLTLEKSRHSVAEHHEIDEIITKLEETDYSSAGWLVEAKNLQHKVHHHLDEEEHEVFQMGGKVLSDKQKQQLASDYDSEMQQQKKKSW